MSEALEKFIKAHQKEFDVEEPGADLWAKIESGLDLNKKETSVFRLKNYGFVLKIAAVLLVFVFAGILFNNYIKYNSSDLNRINPVYAKQEMQFIALIEQKQSELKILSKKDPKLYQDFEKEVSKLNRQYDQLKADLLNTPNQDKVLKAMVRNLQLQLNILNQQLNIINEINQLKTEQNYENIQI